MLHDSSCVSYQNTAPPFSCHLKILCVSCSVERGEPLNGLNAVEFVRRLWSLMPAGGHDRCLGGLAPAGAGCWVVCGQMVQLQAFLHLHPAARR